MFADLTIYFDVSFTDRGGTVHPFVSASRTRKGWETLNVL